MVQAGSTGVQLAADGFETLDPQAGVAEARRRLGRTFRPGELVWQLGERFDPQTPAWSLDVLRQGANGRWVRQRYRYDMAAEVLYFLGESPLSDAEFRDARASGALFRPE
jgi:hypothetical protein